ncbi:MAG: helix-turn-helix transcriptional regulator [Clostridia bacterium]|nr:helix-turn-helix transcriptional regulator [Clostridia bacterium]
MTYFGDNLYTLRKRAGMSQEEFAERLGVSRQAVSKWERCEAYPDTENLIAIAKLFGVSLDELVNSPDIESVLDSNDGARDDRYGKVVKVKRGIPLLYAIPYPIIVTVVYLLLGFLTERGWAVGWTLYVTIPVYYSLIDCIKARRLSSFAYPVFMTFIYFLFGMLYAVWHPLWVIFLTIPIYYAIADAIDKK